MQGVTACNNMHDMQSWTFTYIITFLIEQASQSSGHGTELDRVQEASGQCSHPYGLSFGWSCVKPGLDDPQGSLPTQGII